MSKIRVFVALLLIINVSDATARILLADDKRSPMKVSPSPAPSSVPVKKESNQNPLPKAAPPPDSSKNGAKKEEGSKSGHKDEDKKGKMNDKEKESDGPSKSREEGHVDKSQVECVGLKKCKKGGWIACLQRSENDSKELAIIVQNVGESTLDMNIAVPPSVVTDTKTLSLAKHSTKKVKVSGNSMENLTITLKAGKEECEFQIATVPPVTDWMQQFPAYAKQLPPMYGAYFLFLVLLIAGGIWGFCRFRNRGRRAVDGVAYQQLEMGARTQSSADIVESSNADGWDQTWDDDWDEEATVRPTSPNGHVSSNGLYSRSASKKNDWDIDWDD